jgi:hypothetical protein
LDELMRLPRALWRPLLIVIDEAHMFCPEKGAGSAVSKAAVTALCTRGRKRGFCAVLATQRIAKLDKDVAAELNNVLIGRTGLDVDVTRAGNALGFDKERRQTLPYLDPGVFYSFGPAISREVVRVRTGPVSTTHPEPGHIAPTVPPPPEQLRGLIAQLADLPAHVDETAQDLEGAQLRIGELERRLREQSATPRIETRIERVEVPVLQDGQIERLEQAVQQIAAAGGQLQAIAQDFGASLAKLNPTRTGSEPLTTEHGRREEEKRGRGGEGERRTQPTPNLQPPTPDPQPLTTESSPLRAGERRMLETLARRYPLKLTRAQLGTLADFSPRGGTFTTYLGTLKRAGFVEESDGELWATPAGLAHLGYKEPPAQQTTAQLLAMWRGALRAGERKMLDLLVGVYPSWRTRGWLAQQAGYEVSGGTFGTYLGTLRRNDLVEVSGDNVRASETLFLEGKEGR